MINEIVGAISINPDEVRFQLSKASFYYPHYGEADDYKGWSHIAVIPSLYSLTAKYHKFPTPDEGIRHLMQLCDTNLTNDARVIRRGHKLYMDFARDMHTMGLLQRCSVLSYVEYQKAFDVNGVDYIASILSYLLTCEPKDYLIGVQSAMRANWSQEQWTRIKQKRLKARSGLEWSGQLFYLTNKTRPITEMVKGCWLFGASHIRDLAHEIQDRLNLNLPAETHDIGIQLKLERE